jgi:O-antigen ligase/Tfp pilus assembly protein PilF
VAAVIVLAVMAPGALAPAPRAWLRDPLRLGVGLFVLSAVVSTLVSRSAWISLQGANESYFGLLTVLAYVVIFCATRHLCRSADDAWRLMLAPVAAAAVTATYAVVQMAGVDPILYGRTAGLAGFVRPFATMGHPNFLAAFLAAALPLVALAAIRALGQGRRGLAGVFTLAGALAGVAVAVSVSRGAWLALGAATAVLVVGAVTGAQRRAAVVTAAIATGATLILGILLLVLPTGGSLVSGLVQRVREFGQSAGRQHIWQAAWGLFRDHPVLGTGLDTFQIAFADQRTAAYWTIEWNASPTRAHNEALNLLATQGLLGGVAVVVFTVGVLLAVRRALRATGDRLLVTTLAAGVAAFYVQDLFSFTVAGCGTLAVVQVALLSRLAEGDGKAAARDGVESLALALGSGVVIALAVFAHNLVPDLLVDEPRRVIGIALVLLALVGTGVAIFVLEQRGRPPAFAGGLRVPTRGSTLGPVVRWGLAVVALAVLVVRPLAASNAAHEGIQLTTDLPAAAVVRLRRAVALEPFSELYWVKLGSAAHAAARKPREPGDRRRLLEEARAAYERAARLVPANSYNHANLGRALADLSREGIGAPGDAFARFDRALAMDPNNAYFYADAANASLLVGDLDRARDYAARAVTLYPRFAVPRAQLGHIAMVRRRRRSAPRWRATGTARRAAPVRRRTWRRPCCSSTGSTRPRRRRASRSASTRPRTRPATTWPSPSSASAAAPRPSTSIAACPSSSPPAPRSRPWARRASSRASRHDRRAARR